MSALPCVCAQMHHYAPPPTYVASMSMQGGTPGRHHLRRLHRPPRRRPAPRSQLQPQHQPPASPRPGTLRNCTPPVATVQERAWRGYGGGWGEYFTCRGCGHLVRVAPGLCACIPAPIRAEQGGRIPFPKLRWKHFAALTVSAGRNVIRQ